MKCHSRVQLDMSQYEKEQVMGNRDKRGREKKKPKQERIKQKSKSEREAPEYKPGAPAAQQPTSAGSGESS